MAVPQNGESSPELHVSEKEGAAPAPPAPPAEPAAPAPPAAPKPKGRSPKIRVINAWCVTASIVLAAIAIAVSALLLNATRQSEDAHARYEECSQAATELMIASDYLTTQSRMFAVTEDRSYMDGYIEELLVTKRRDDAVATLNRDLEDARAAAKLSDALGESNELAVLELYAMRMTVEAAGIEPVPDMVAAVILDAEDAALSPDEKHAKAEEMLLGDKYSTLKSAIVQSVDDCTQQLIQGIQQKEAANELRVERLLFFLIAIVALLVCLVCGAAIANHLLITRPMKAYVKSIEDNEALDPMGALELRRMVTAYNNLYEQNRERTRHLRREAETDALTGLLNRGSYDRLLGREQGPLALILADIDRFKQVNDQYGHQIGDRVLQKVASVIAQQFRTSDFVCRIGGDEFAIIMDGVTAENRNIVASKLESIAAGLAAIEDDLPEVTLSFGVAFSGRLGEGGNIYHAADKALYGAKHKGRNAYMFFGEE